MIKFLFICEIIYFWKLCLAAADQSVSGVNSPACHFSVTSKKFYLVPEETLIPSQSFFRPANEDVLIAKAD